MLYLHLVGYAPCHPELALLLRSFPGSLCLDHVKVKVVNIVWDLGSVKQKVTLFGRAKETTVVILFLVRCTRSRELYLLVMHGGKVDKSSYLVCLYLGIEPYLLGPGFLSGRRT